MAGKARARKEFRARTHGWFITPGRDGDRTLESQMRGLAPLMAEIKGKSVLDVGCAEGLIAMEVAAAGAKAVDALEIVPYHLEVAKRINAERGLHVDFWQGDANHFFPDDRYDIVLLLAVLHKLDQPRVACERIAASCDDLCVIRLGPDGTEIIDDARSNNVPQDIGAVMRGLGFDVERRELGPFDEVTWYYRRRKC